MGFAAFLMAAALLTLRAGIFPRWTGVIALIGAVWILELDEYAHDDDRVIEVHPKVSFREVARRPLLSKNRSDGLAERRALLEQAGIELPVAVPRIGEPDLLDATAAAWSARRYARGEALPLPHAHTERIGAIWR
jgi:predicted RNase H-like nuclease